MLVPVWHTSEKGDVFEGRFDVPIRLVRTSAHTNERAEFDQLVNSMLERWTQYRAAKGWVLNSKPKVTGPYEPPTEKTGDEVPDDHKVYMVHARFIREEPLWVPLENAIAAIDKARQFGLDEPEDRKPWNDETNEDSGIIRDPLAWAEARRKKFGIRQEDYLYGPLSEPF